MLIKGLEPCSPKPLITGSKCLLPRPCPSQEKIRNVQADGLEPCSPKPLITGSKCLLPMQCPSQEKIRNVQADGLEPCSPKPLITGSKCLLTRPCPSQEKIRNVQTDGLEPCSLKPLITGSKCLLARPCPSQEKIRNVQTDGLEPCSPKPLITGSKCLLARPCPSQEKIRNVQTDGLEPCSPKPLITGSKCLLARPCPSQEKIRNVQTDGLEPCSPKPLITGSKCLLARPCPSQEKIRNVQTDGLEPCSPKPLITGSKCLLARPCPSQEKIRNVQTDGLEPCSPKPLITVSKCLLPRPCHSQEKIRNVQTDGLEPCSSKPLITVSKCLLPRPCLSQENIRYVQTDGLEPCSPKPLITGSKCLLPRPCPSQENIRYVQTNGLEPCSPKPLITGSKCLLPRPCPSQEKIRYVQKDGLEPCSPKPLKPTPCRKRVKTVLAALVSSEAQQLLEAHLQKKVQKHHSTLLGKISESAQEVLPSGSPRPDHESLKDTAEMNEGPPIKITTQKTDKMNKQQTETCVSTGMEQMPSQVKEFGQNHVFLANSHLPKCVFKGQGIKRPRVENMPSLSHDVMRSLEQILSRKHHVLFSGPSPHPTNSQPSRPVESGTSSIMLKKKEAGFVESKTGHSRELCGQKKLLLAKGTLPVKRKQSFSVASPPPPKMQQKQGVKTSLWPREQKNVSSVPKTTSSTSSLGSKPCVANGGSKRRRRRRRKCHPAVTKRSQQMLIKGLEPCLPKPLITVSKCLLPRPCPSQEKIRYVQTDGLEPCLPKPLITGSKCLFPRPCPSQEKIRNVQTDGLEPCSPKPLITGSKCLLPRPCPSQENIRYVQTGGLEPSSPTPLITGSKCLLPRPCPSQEKIRNVQTDDLEPCSPKPLKPTPCRKRVKTVLAALVSSEAQQRLEEHLQKKVQKHHSTLLGKISESAQEVLPSGSPRPDHESLKDTAEMNEGPPIKITTQKTDKMNKQQTETCVSTGMEQMPSQVKEFGQKHVFLANSHLPKCVFKGQGIKWPRVGNMPSLSHDVMRSLEQNLSRKHHVLFSGPSPHPTNSQPSLPVESGTSSIMLKKKKAGFVESKTGHSRELCGQKKLLLAKGTLPVKRKQSFAVASPPPPKMQQKQGVKTSLWPRETKNASSVPKTTSSTSSLGSKPCVANGGSKRRRRRRRKCHPAVTKRSQQMLIKGLEPCSPKPLITGSKFRLARPCPSQEKIRNVQTDGLEPCSPKPLITGSKCWLARPCPSQEKIRNVQTDGLEPCSPKPLITGSKCRLARPCPSQEKIRNVQTDGLEPCSPKPLITGSKCRLARPCPSQEKIRNVQTDGLEPCSPKPLITGSKCRLARPCPSQEKIRNVQTDGLEPCSPKPLITGSKCRLARPCPRSKCRLARPCPSQEKIRNVHTDGLEPCSPKPLTTGSKCRLARPCPSQEKIRNVHTDGLEPCSPKPLTTGSKCRLARPCPSQEKIRNVQTDGLEPCSPKPLTTGSKCRLARPCPSQEKIRNVQTDGLEPCSPKPLTTGSKCRLARPCPSQEKIRNVQTDGLEPCSPKPLTTGSKCRLARPCPSQEKIRNLQTDGLEPCSPKPLITGSKCRLARPCPSQEKIRNVQTDGLEPCSPKPLITGSKCRLARPCPSQEKIRNVQTDGLEPCSPKPLITGSKCRLARPCPSQEKIRNVQTDGLEPCSPKPLITGSKCRLPRPCPSQEKIRNVQTDGLEPCSPKPLITVSKCRLPRPCPSQEKIRNVQTDGLEPCSPKPLITGSKCLIPRPCPSQEKIRYVQTDGLEPCSPKPLITGSKCLLPRPCPSQEKIRYVQTDGLEPCSPKPLITGSKCLLPRPCPSQEKIRYVQTVGLEPLSPKPLITGSKCLLPRPCPSQEKIRYVQKDGLEPLSPKPLITGSKCLLPRPCPSQEKNRYVQKDSLEPCSPKPLITGSKCLLPRPCPCQKKIRYVQKDGLEPCSPKPLITWSKCLLARPCPRQQNIRHVQTDGLEPCSPKPLITGNKYLLPRPCPSQENIRYVQTDGLEPCSPKPLITGSKYLLPRPWPFQENIRYVQTNGLEPCLPKPLITSSKCLLPRPCPSQENIRYVQTDNKDTHAKLPSEPHMSYKQYYSKTAAKETQMFMESESGTTTRIVNCTCSPLVEPNAMQDLEPDNTRKTLIHEQLFTAKPEMPRGAFMPSVPLQRPPAESSKKKENIHINLVDVTLLNENCKHLLELHITRNVTEENHECPSRISSKAVDKLMAHMPKVSATSQCQTQPTNRNLHTSVISIRSDIYQKDANQEARSLQYNVFVSHFHKNPYMVFQHRHQLQMKHTKSEFKVHTEGLLSMEVLFPKQSHLGGRHLKSRTTFLPFAEHNIIDTVDWNLRHKLLRHLWGLAPLHHDDYKKSNTKDLLCPPPPAEVTANTELAEVESDFLMLTQRALLEQHIQMKTMHSGWGLPTLLRSSLQAVMASSPECSSIEACPQPEDEIVMIGEEAFFSPETTRKCVESHAKQRIMLQDFGLPNTAEESLAEFFPPSTCHEALASQKEATVDGPRLPASPASTTESEANDSALLVAISKKQKESWTIFGTGHKLSIRTPPAISETCLRRVRKLMFFVEQDAIDCIEKNLRQKHLMSKWWFPSPHTDSACKMALARKPAPQLTHRCRVAIESPSTKILCGDSLHQLELQIAKKCIEVRLGAIPLAVKISVKAMYSVQTKPLPKQTTVCKSPKFRNSAPIFAEQRILEPIEMNLKKKYLASLWGLPSLYVNSLMAKWLPLPPSAVHVGGVNTVSSKEKLFLNEEIRELIELHVRKKRLHQELGLPVKLWKIFNWFTPRPSTLSGPKKTKVNRVVLTKKPFFITQKTHLCLDYHIKRVQMQQRDGLPENIIQSLKHFMPGAPEIPESTPHSPIEECKGPLRDPVKGLSETRDATTRALVDAWDPKQHSQSSKQISSPRETLKESKKTEIIFLQLHLVQKYIEIHLQQFPSRVVKSWNSVQTSEIDELAKTVFSSRISNLPRPTYLTFMEQFAIEQINQNLVHKHLMLMSAMADAESSKTLAPQACTWSTTHTRPKWAVMEFVDMQTSFLAGEKRDALKFHVDPKRLQYDPTLPFASQRTTVLSPMPAKFTVTKPKFPTEVNIRPVELTFIEKATEEKLVSSSRSSLASRACGLSIDKELKPQKLQMSKQESPSRGRGPMFVLAKKRNTNILKKWTKQRRARAMESKKHNVGTIRQCSVLDTLAIGAKWVDLNMNLENPPSLCGVLSPSTNIFPTTIHKPCSRGPRFNHDGPYIEFSAMETSFLGCKVRTHLDWHVRKKSLQQECSLPQVVQNSLQMFIPPTQYLLRSPYNREAKLKILPLIWKLEFIDEGIKEQLEFHIQRLIVQKRFGLSRHIQDELKQSLLSFPTSDVQISDDQDSVGSFSTRSEASLATKGSIAAEDKPQRFTDAYATTASHFNNQLEQHLPRKCLEASHGENSPAMPKQAGKDIPNTSTDASSKMAARRASKSDCIASPVQRKATFLQNLMSKLKKSIFKYGQRKIKPKKGGVEVHGPSRESGLPLKKNTAQNPTSKVRGKEKVTKRTPKIPKANTKTSSKICPVHSTPKPGMPIKTISSPFSIGDTASSGQKTRDRETHKAEDLLEQNFRVDLKDIQDGRKSLKERRKSEHVASTPIAKEDTYFTRHTLYKETSKSTQEWEANWELMSGRTARINQSSSPEWNVQPSTANTSASCVTVEYGLDSTKTHGESGEVMSLDVIAPRGSRHRGGETPTIQDNSSTDKSTSLMSYYPVTGKRHADRGPGYSSLSTKSSSSRHKMFCWNINAEDHI
ncbi:hypothetical protein NDU88_003085 [Pleurodeles waltl]|uniref:SPATA31 domain-containing protein n=1 Tax=Pleurodeles waltl TaxID=8319 RepID=A0AAV7TQ03_PLEWA|nr:hypothetical protein NDU88_003085 [Pleurodeles waltl]